MIVVNTAGFPKDANIRYTDKSADTGLALTLGGGLDIRINRKLRFREVMDYDPTFLKRGAE